VLDIDQHKKRLTNYIRMVEPINKCRTMITCSCVNNFTDCDAAYVYHVWCWQLKLFSFSAQTHTDIRLCVCVCVCARKLDKYARNCLKQSVCIGRRSANSFSV